MNLRTIIILFWQVNRCCKSNVAFDEASFYISKGCRKNHDFCLVLITKEPIILKEIVGTNTNLFSTIIIAINFVMMKSIAKSTKKKKSQQQPEQQVKLIEEYNIDDDHLFMAS
ncbi:hypothetical protein CR513_35216, partial [Mucuna pruriens]